MNNIEKLFSLLMGLPPSFVDIENELKNNDYTSEEITLVACKFAENCFCESRDFEDEHGRKPDVEEVHSSYIYSVCKLLLKYGLNPNLVVGDENNQTNIIYELRYVEHKYVAAETVRMLLENGGSTHIVVNGVSVFDELDYDVVFDVVELENKSMFDAEFKLWLMMIGYGAKMSDGKSPLEIKEGYDISKFRYFENYSYSIEFVEHDWFLHIFDDSGTEVAKV